MPRFVLLLHEMPSGSAKANHWDLMLESGDVLLTWSLAELPDSNRSIAASSLPDHRIAYLDYEGPVSNNRGHVRRCDKGEYRWRCQNLDVLEFDVSGKLLDGRIRLARSADADDWKLHFSPRETVL